MNDNILLFGFTDVTIHFFKWLTFYVCLTVLAVVIIVKGEKFVETIYSIKKLGKPIRDSFSKMFTDNLRDGNIDVIEVPNGMTVEDYIRSKGIKIKSVKPLDNGNKIN